MYMESSWIIALDSQVIDLYSDSSGYDYNNQLCSHNLHMY